jgi:protein-tyrosine phosphatase
MIDIHAHVLPGVDDGASTLEVSVAMLKMALNNGVSTLIATPHINAKDIFYNHYEKDLNKSFFSLSQIIDNLRLPITLLPGMEVFGSEEIPELLSEGKLTTLNHSRYLLMEFDFSEEAELIEYLLVHIVQQGYCPIIAHPERYPYVQRYPELVFRWIKLGGVLQVNKGSFLGSFGIGARDMADYLLEHRLASFIASDAHGTVRRTTQLSQVYHLIKSGISAEYADMLFVHNPDRVVRDQELIDTDKTSLLRGMR